MAAILLEPTTHVPAPATMPDEDTEIRDVSCPVCGSGSTYQTSDGRWGCVQCGSTWS
jgi:ribosomal protein S27AE